MVQPISNFVSYNKLSKNYRAFVTNLSKIEIPSSIQDALMNREWKAAIDEELKVLQKNETWELKNLPTRKKINCKWVCNVKYKVDGFINRYKTRLVAKGFTQTHGVDYQETFTSVAKLNTVKVLLPLATNSDWPLYQLDVKNAFLNVDLEEEVYMEFPSGFEHLTSQTKFAT